MTLAEIAGEAYEHFESRERGEDKIITTKDDAPEWVSDLVREAHGDFLPNDWRYDCIYAAIGHVHDSGAEDDSDLDDVAHEFCDGYVDVYTHARLQWLASSLNRMAYCDEAVEEGLIGSDASIAERVGLGQYMEAREIFASVQRSLVNRHDEIDEETAA